MLSATLQSVIMLSVIMLSAIANERQDRVSIKKEANRSEPIP